MAQQDLTLVGLAEDGKTLVLVSDAGAEYTLAADAKLRAALRGEHARLGKLEIQMESALRPRDIQARIRAGESPETVAAAAQTTVERIMVFATPVLAERAHIADRAQRSSVRRKAGDGPARLLGDAVAERLHARSVDPSTVTWDAWRRQDGRWTLVADYLSGESSRHAEFVYDAPGRFVIAEDDEARWLVGEQSTRKGPQPRAGGTPRRLSAVNAEEELPLGADAIDMVNSTAEAADDRGGADEEPVAAEGDADWIATHGGERPAAPDATAEDDAAPDPSPGPETEPDDEDEPAKKPTKKSRGRPSVPSWDEIMFGGERRE
jgi:hypothetical protein